MIFTKKCKPLLTFVHFLAVTITVKFQTEKNAFLQE